LDLEILNLEKIVDIEQKETNINKNKVIEINQEKKQKKKSKTKAQRKELKKTKDKADEQVRLNPSLNIQNQLLKIKIWIKNKQKYS
jgi:hypothetical protein